jgi:hypothetical protein
MPLFQLGPHSCLAVPIHFYVNHIRLAAHRAIFHVFLLFALRQIDRHDDFLAARSAGISRFVVHRRIVAISRSGMQTESPYTTFERLQR